MDVLYIKNYSKVIKQIKEYHSNDWKLRFFKLKKLNLEKKTKIQVKFYKKQQKLR